jgi:hypothetical protein
MKNLCFSSNVLPFRCQDAVTLEREFTSGGVIASVHSPRSAVAWIEAHYDDPLLEQLRSRDFDGPMAVQLSGDESALAIFGSIADALAPQITQALADFSRFAVMVRSAVDNPIIGFVPNAQTQEEMRVSVEREHNAAHLRGGAADDSDADADDDQPQPEWEGKYHNATVDLRLKMTQSAAYDVNISSYIKVGCRNWLCFHSYVPYYSSRDGHWILRYFPLNQK